jgi:hypothetical protein
MRKVTTFFAALLLILSGSASMAKHRKPVQRWGNAAPQYLSPEAARMKEAQKMWPNVPLCDEGGYRIRPCDIGGGPPD